MKILIIEDDKPTAETVRDILKRYYIVEIAPNGEEGEYLAMTNIYDFLLIDYLLPDIDGLEICKKIRTGGITTPVILLTGNREMKNKINAFCYGADDYITKPFNGEELHARIEAVYRRSTHSLSSTLLTVADLSLDIARKTAVRSGVPIVLKRKEMDLLEYLMRNAGRVVTRSMILDHIWDSSNDSITNIVDVHIKYLRDRIDRNFPVKLIKTVHGYGYKIEA